MTLGEAREMLNGIDLRDLYHVPDRIPAFLELRGGINFCSALFPPKHKLPTKTRIRVQRFYIQAKKQCEK